MARLNQRTEATGPHGDPFAPRAGSNPQAWCDYHNDRLGKGKTGMEWFVDSGGSLRLRTKDYVIIQRVAADKAAAKAEAAKHAHRLRYPVDRMASDAA